MSNNKISSSFSSHVSTNAKQSENVHIEKSIFHQIAKAAYKPIKFCKELAALIRFFIMPESKKNDIKKSLDDIVSHYNIKNLLSPKLISITISNFNKKLNSSGERKVTQKWIANNLDKIESFLEPHTKNGILEVNIDKPLLKELIKSPKIAKSILFQACNNNNIWLAKEVFNTDSISKQDKKTGNEALELALDNNNRKMIKLLIKTKIVDPNVLLNKRNDTLLTWACFIGDKNILASLLKFPGIKMNAKDAYGNTAFMCACLKRHKDIATKLFKTKNYDINAKNNTGKTAFIQASKFGHTEMVAYLREIKGIDCNADDKTECTALIHASRAGHLEIVDTLLKFENIDINAQDIGGKTAFAYALDNKFAPVTEEKFSYASEEKKEKIIVLLYKTGKINTINKKDERGLTALMQVCYLDNIKLVKLICEDPNLNVNSKDNKGNTALMYACDSGNIEIVKALLEFENLDILTQNNRGYMAFDMSADNRGNIKKVLHKALQARTKIASS